MECALPAHRTVPSLRERGRFSTLTPGRFFSGSPKAGRISAESAPTLSGSFSFPDTTGLLPCPPDPVSSATHVPGNTHVVIRNLPDPLWRPAVSTCTPRCGNSAFRLRLSAQGPAGPTTTAWCLWSRTVRGFGLCCGRPEALLSLRGRLFLCPCELAFPLFSPVTTRPSFRSFLLSLRTHRFAPFLCHRELVVSPSPFVTARSSFRPFPLVTASSEFRLRSSPISCGSETASSLRSSR